MRWRGVDPGGLGEHTYRWYRELTGGDCRLRRTWLPPLHHIHRSTITMARRGTASLSRAATIRPPMSGSALAENVDD